MDSVGEGEGGKIWENDIETCIISCMKQTNKKKTENKGHAKELMLLNCGVGEDS